MRHSLNTDYWDSVAQGTHKPLFEKNIAAYYRNEHLKLIRKWSADIRGKNILKTDLYEEAFREGDFIFWFLEQNANVYGMDISYNIANKAKAHSKDYNVYFKNCIVSDIRGCSFKDESFDLIISNSTIDNLAPCDVSKALLELRRILKPEGILILTIDNKNNPLYFLGYLAEKLLKTNKYYQSRCYSVGETVSLAKKNNFIVLEISAIVHIPTPFNKIALLLEKMGIKTIEKSIGQLVELFSKLGDRRTQFLTGWFLALKLKKNDK